MKHQDVTEKIISAFYAAYNTLGWGFLERVYQAAMEIELRKRGLHVIPQAPIKVLYEGVCIGEYFADLLVEGCVIVEIKAVERFAEAHEAQLLNYLKATTIDVGLLMNFGPKPEYRRKIFETARTQPREVDQFNG